MRCATSRSTTRAQRPRVLEPEEAPPPNPFIVTACYEEFDDPPDWALDERMISRGTAERYGLRWNKGWIIPVWASPFDGGKHELWGWQFKRLDTVLNYPKGVKKSLTLFGLRELVSSTVVLVESPLDVVRLASVGVIAVASYGAFVSKAQLRLLIEVADKLILALDNDKEGVAQTSKIFPVLSKVMPTKGVIFPDGAKDPGDLDDDQVAKVFRRDFSRHTPSVSSRRRQEDARPRSFTSRS